MGTDSTALSAPLPGGVSADFALADATELAHALCAEVSRASSARALSIKGPVANLQAIRRSHASADADVLVDPSGLVEFCAELERHGWRKWVGRETPSLLPTHAWTYTHPQWPCAIDVHSRYPGFFASPAVVFDALWADRSVAMIAHTTVIGPSRAASAVIGALHAARHPSSPRHQDETRQIAELLREGFSGAEREAFYRLARTGRALTVLNDLITDADLGPRVDDLSLDERRRWLLMLGPEEGASALGWVDALRDVPMLQKPGLVARALWVHREDIPRNDPALVPSRGDAWRYRWTRWIRGAKLLSKYLRLTRDR